MIVDLENDKNDEGLGEWVLTLTDEQEGIFWTSRHHTQAEALFALGYFSADNPSTEEYIYSRAYLTEMRKLIQCII